MLLGLINSVWAQAGKETVWGLRKTKEIGFDCVDIFTDPLEIDVRERRQIRTECQRLDLPIISVCCVATGLIDFNPSVRRFHYERCRSYLDLVYEFEGRNLLLVLGEYIWNREVISPTEQWRYGVEQLIRLGDYATSLGLQIVLELEPFPLSLLNNVTQMKRFLDDVAHPAVGANIDISHLCLARVAPAELHQLQGKAWHVHLSDCNGQTHGDLPPGHGVVDFDAYLRQLATLQINGTISLELEYPPQPDQVEAWVREAYTASAALLDRYDLRTRR
ncbi:MAG: hypothetical protein KatS3mg113_0385 [Planctomycetaceae bacterium]|nr:MAG: hypothetical protein KatS3mg113_0385 [Planctomycetaceae bacterium]